MTFFWRMFQTGINDCHAYLTLQDPQIKPVLNHWKFCWCSTCSQRSWCLFSSHEILKVARNAHSQRGSKSSLFPLIIHSGVQEFLFIKDSRGGWWCSSWEPVVKLDSPAGVWSHQAVRCLSRNQSKSFPTQHSELETVRNTDTWLSTASLLRVTVTSSVYLTSNCGISQYTRLPVQSRLWHGNWTTFHKPCIYLGFLWLP